MNGIVYSSYSGYVGDCGNYHGWVVGVDINNPTNVHGWATTAMGGGIWGHGGVASDGTNMFVVTGNTFNTGGNWMGGEAIIRLQAGPTWTGQPTDYWAPTNWFSLDNSDTDLGGVSATIVDVPGATPSQLVLALGKDSNAYLLNRNNLGGIPGTPYQANVGGTNRGISAVTYHTSQGTYIGFHNDAGTVRAYKITPTNPPTITFGLEPKSERARLALGHDDRRHKQYDRVVRCHARVVAINACTPMMGTPAPLFMPAAAPTN